MKRIQRLASASSSTSSHLNAAQTTIAVKKEDIAYTSASTAENQKLSEKVYTKAPINPDNNRMILSDLVNESKVLFKILRPIRTMVQCKNKMVKALDTTDIIFTQKATRLTSPRANKENMRPINKKSGAPGGCGTCNL